MNFVRDYVFTFSGLLKNFWTDFGQDPDLNLWQFAVIKSLPDSLKSLIHVTLNLCEIFPLNYICEIKLYIRKFVALQYIEVFEILVFCHIHPDISTIFYRLSLRQRWNLIWSDTKNFHWISVVTKHRVGVCCNFWIREIFILYCQSWA